MKISNNILNGEERQDHRLSMRITEDEQKTLHKLARMDGVSVSGYIRNLVRNDIKKRRLVRKLGGFDD